MRMTQHLSPVKFAKELNRMKSNLIITVALGLALVGCGDKGPSSGSTVLGEGISRSDLRNKVITVEDFCRGIINRFNLCTTWGQNNQFYPSMNYCESNLKICAYTGTDLGEVVIEDLTCEQVEGFLQFPDRGIICL